MFEKMGSVYVTKSKENSEGNKLKEMEEIIDNVAERVLLKSKQTNNILSNCVIKSNLVKDKTEEMFEKIFRVNTNEIIIKEKYNKNYDLSAISRIFGALDTNIESSGVEKRLRTGSASSIASDDNYRDNISESKRHLKDIRDVLGNMENNSIEMYNEDECTENVLTQNNQFSEHVLLLQRLAREMTIIASTDNMQLKKNYLHDIDDTLISKLNKLNKCLIDLISLDENKNPIANIGKKVNLKLEFTDIINKILEVMESH